MISVIVPVYNVENYLIECVDSILSQTYRNLEIILVDDGSTDTSGQICDELSNYDTRIKVIHKKNGGLSSSRNAGLMIASGNYVSFIDSDDYIEPTMFEEMIKKFIEYPNVDIVSCYFDRFTDGSKKFKPFLKYKNSNLYTNLEFLSLIFRHKLDNAVCNKIYKKSCLNNFRFVEGKINEDLLFNILVLINSNSVYYIDKPFYKYRQREGSITNKINPKQFNYVENAFEVRRIIREKSLSMLYSSVEAFLVKELTNYLSLLYMYNAKDLYKSEFLYCRNYLKSIVLRSVKNRDLSLKNKFKLLSILFFPFLYLKTKSFYERCHENIDKLIMN